MKERVPYIDKHGKALLPGFGIPVDEAQPYLPHTAFFLCALNPARWLKREMIIPLRELIRLRIMDELTSKPGWEKKIYDETITAKWTDEVLNYSLNVTKSMVEFVLDQLRYKAEVFVTTSVISVCNAGVVKSDTIVPADFKVALKDAVRVLEDVPDDKKDWHPGSDEKVLDLVHPSLFPLVYGKSKILPDKRMGIDGGLKMSGKGVVIPVPSGYELHTSWDKILSRKFQWLPCEVDIQGEKAKITSYINNLHPKEHARLYELVEQLVEYSIPLWNAVLTSLRDVPQSSSPGWRTLPRQEAFRLECRKPYKELVRVPYEQTRYNPEYDDLSDSEGPQKAEGKDEYDFRYRREEWWKDMGVTVQPEPTKGPMPLTAADPVSLRDQYKQHGLQVIVKLASIILTPEKPEYEGGTWHVEGQLNERIVASSLYYYSSENITASKLAFRQQCDDDARSDSIWYQQEDHQWLPEAFGLDNKAPAVRELGGVKTPEGRLLAFPNTLQHQVQPFKLEDPTKPGHRKIVALFLVDPNMKIISTANIPCQRKDWWREELEDCAALAKLPLELRDQIVDSVEFPIGMKQAKKFREELIEERKHFVIDRRDKFTGMRMSLCKH